MTKNKHHVNLTMSKPYCKIFLLMLLGFKSFASFSAICRAGGQNKLTRRLQMNHWSVVDLGLRLNTVNFRTSREAL